MSNDEPSHPPKDPADALNEVVDDSEAHNEAIEWAHTQFTADRTAEDITADLVSQGWEGTDAAELVEQVRRMTRRERGVVTRQDVMRGINHNYGRGMRGGWLVGMPTLAAAFRLIYSILNLLRLKR